MKNITKKIIASLLPILCLCCILGLITSFVGFRSSVKDVELSHLQQTLRISAKHKLADMNHLLNEMVDDLEQTAKTINQYDDLNHPDVLDILQLSNDMSSFDHTGVTDLSGTGYDQSGTVVHLADRDYFQTAIQGQVAFSEVLHSKVFPDDLVQIIAHPLRSDDQDVRGIVYGVFNLDTFSDLLSYHGQKSDSNLYIVDSCGAYIGKFQTEHSDSSTTGFWTDLGKTSLDSETIFQIKSDFEDRKEGSFSFNYGEEQFYVCHMPIGPNKWQLVCSVSDSSTKEIVQSLYLLDTKNTVIATTCYLILIACIVWYFHQSNHRIRMAHQEATRNMEFMHMAIEHSNNIVFEYDQKKHLVRLKNDIRNQLFCCTEIANVPQSFLTANIIAPDSIAAFQSLFQEIKTKRSCTEDIQLVSEDVEIWYRISMNNIYDDQKHMIGTVGVVDDISEQKQQESEMKQKLQIQETLIANALIYAKIDLETDTLLEWNGKKANIPYQDFLTQQVPKTVSEEHMNYVFQKLSLDYLSTVLQDGQESGEIQFLMKRPSGDRWVSCMAYHVYLDPGSIILLVVTDIDARKRLEIALKEQAEHDGLTGLYNAAACRSKINEIVSAQNTLNEQHVFVLFDLDNYKQINDTFGHNYGDQVLIDVAEMLNTRFRSSDIVGRLGGDEFVVLLRSINSYDYAAYLIEELCKSIHKTYRVDNKEVTLSASIGIAIAPDDGCTFEELYKKSDIAQYQVKKHGKNGFKRYQSLKP